ncbi:MAG: DUF4870 domain-containing protein [Candidatus Kuenenbacteria bacterium]
MSEQKVTKEQENRIIAALSYIWVLCLVPLLTRRNDEYCQFHAKQGLVLFVGSFAVMVLGMIPVLGWLIILPLGWLFLVILSILGIINALQGKKWKMPYVGKYAEKINL